MVKVNIECDVSAKHTGTICTEHLIIGISVKKQGTYQWYDLPWKLNAALCPGDVFKYGPIIWEWDLPEGTYDARIAVWTDYSGGTQVTGGYREGGTLLDRLDYEDISGVFTVTTAPPGEVKADILSVSITRA